MSRNDKKRKQSTNPSQGYQTHGNKKKIKTMSRAESQLLARFDRIEIEGDGNCLFRAILYYLVADDSSHSELRTLICDHIINNRTSYTAVVPNNDVDLYVEELLHDGTWGDHLELFIASSLLSFNFRIYKSKSLEIYYEHENSPNYATIFLEYENRNHFNALI